MNFNDLSEGEDSTQFTEIKQSRVEKQGPVPALETLIFNSTLNIEK